MTGTLRMEKSHAQLENGVLARQVLEELISQGVGEFCVCPGSRNAPFVYPLVNATRVRIYYWPEERSATFFALGRIKATGRPVAVVTTSGTAVAELLPATMEAFYTGLPLVLLTADRPRNFRGTGAPQSAEQVGIFHRYADTIDLAHGEHCSIGEWQRQSPIHLNVCFEEPDDEACKAIRISSSIDIQKINVQVNFSPDGIYLSFMHRIKFPFVIIGALPASVREAVVRFLLHINAPLYAEGSSGIREEPRLAHLHIQCPERMRDESARNGYPIDGILRIGGVPTHRLWRDLEFLRGEIEVCSISEQPFSGLSHGRLVQTDLNSFFTWASSETVAKHYPYEEWKNVNNEKYQRLIALFHDEPLSEASLVHEFSRRLPMGTKVYLGNSLPIREWDQAATYEQRHYRIGCNRGVNGIDGQLATFLGFCSPEQDNWAILGDLTLLYDLVGPWISSQMKGMNANIVVVNNGGGQIFSRMHTHSAFLNSHQLSFEPLAQFWKWRYEKWETIPEQIDESRGFRLVELLPDQGSTDRFFQKWKKN